MFLGERLGKVAFIYARSIKRSSQHQDVPSQNYRVVIRETLGCFRSPAREHRFPNQIQKFPDFELGGLEFFAVLFEDRDPREAVFALMSREPTEEMGDLLEPRR